MTRLIRNVLLRLSLISCLLVYPLANGEETEGFEKVTYEFESEIWIDNPTATLAEKQLATVKTHAVIQLHTIMWANDGDIVNKVELTSCTTTSNGVTVDCVADNPTMYVLFDSSKLQSTGWYATSNAPKYWNTMFGAGSLLFEMLDQIGERRVELPVGSCRRKVRENEAKDEIQRVFDCVPHAQSTSTESMIGKLSDLTYYQIVTIKDDVKSADVTSRETLIVKQPAYPGANVTVQTFSHITQLEVTDSEDLSCAHMNDTAECMQLKGATLVAKSWDQLLQYIRNQEKKTHQTTQSSVSFSYAVTDALKSIKKDPSRLPAEFHVLVQLAKLQKKKQLVATLTEFKTNKDSLRFIADVLAAAGTSAGYKAASELPDDVFERYLNALPMSLNVEQDVLEMLMNGLTNKKRQSVVIAEASLLTLSTLVHRGCNRQQCTPENQALSNKLLVHIVRQLQLQLKQPAATAVYFDALQNLANNEEVVKAVYDFLCDARTTYEYQLAALNVLAQIPVKLWNEKSKAAVRSLAFKSCPNEVNSLVQARAASLLLTNYKAHTQLLPALFSLIGHSDKEVSALLLSQTLQQSNTDTVFRAYMLNAAEQGTFPLTDWNRQATGGQSMVVRNSLFNASKSNTLDSTLSAIFTNGNFRSAHTSVTRGQQHQLLQLDVLTSGLQGVLGGGDSEEGESVSGAVQLSLLGAKQRPLSLFESQSELMSALWNADGTHYPVYQTNAILHRSKHYYPLASGFAFEVQGVHSAHLNIKASALVSLWNRNAVAKAMLSGSAGSEHTFSVYGSNPVITGYIRVSTGTELEAIADVEFYDNPEFCIKLERKPAKLSWNLNILLPQLINVEKNRSLPAETIRLPDSVSKQCAPH